MKRSTQIQEKTKNAPAKSDATKLKDMQKAYGISAKDISSKTRVSVKTSSGAGDGSSIHKTAVTNATSQRLRNSTGATHLSTKPKPDSMSTSRKSLPGESTNSKSSSKIIAASKANYAEKYGSTKGITSEEQKNKVNSQMASTNKRSSNNNNAAINGGGTTSPYKNKTGNKSSPSKTSVKSNSSTTSRLTSQKPPMALYESEASSEPAAGGDYEDEDFEEDYESDFEEAMSSAAVSEDEPEPEISKQNVVGIVRKQEEVEETPVENEDYDKSSSIREFEHLEKLVESEEEKKLKNGNGRFGNLKEDTRGSGEPASTGISTMSRPILDEKSEEEEEDEEEDSVAPSTPVERKQNAFPQTKGFSIATSMPQNNEQFGGHRERKSALAARRSTVRGNGEMLKTSSQGPLVESNTQMRKRANRGKIIQGMIKLDRVQVDIFHLAPYQYERFMTVFSGADRLQSSSQTDQDKSEESAQTDPIEQNAKWTQKPPTWSTTSSSCDIRIVRQEALGVGSDDISEDLSPDDQKIHKQFDFLKNWEQLSKFILRASRKMLYVLEAEERIKLPANSGNKGSLETIKMNRGLSVLSKLPMHTLACDGEFVGCANGTQQAVSTQDKTTNGNKKHTSKNLVTVWSLKEPSMPLHFLRVWGHVSALKLHMIGRMVVSGNKDGSLNVWNLDESMCYHAQYQEQVIRTPSVNTSCMMATHNLPIIGIEMFSDSKNTFSIISIDREGLLITWSCLRAHDALGESESTLSQHSSAWSTIHMSVRHQIKLGDITRDHLQITCFSSFWDVDATTMGFYFGTFNGYVAKGKVVVEGASLPTTTIEKYQERLDSNPKIICMDISKTLNILVVGCEDGRCRLFELSRKKMVLSLGGKQEPIRVKWSGRRASVLYVALKDSLLIWDLLSSDMNPWKTIHLKDILDFVLYSPPHKEYLVIISGNDLIISTPAEEVKPLSNREFARIQSYFAALC